MDSKPEATLAELAKQGRQLLDSHDGPIERHNEFLSWVEDVAAWLDAGTPHSGLSAEWGALPASVLVRAGGYDDSDGADQQFTLAVQKRLKWLSTVFSRVATSTESRPRVSGREAALTLLGELRQELEQIKHYVESTGDTTATFEKLKRWKARAVRLVSEKVSDAEGSALLAIEAPIILGDPHASAVRGIDKYAGFITALRQQIKEHPEDILGKQSTASAPAARAARQQGAKVFIGHGRSKAWRDLKDFLQDRLHLQWEEFNRISAAGVSTIARLGEMLDTAAFAFLVLTAEDEHADGKINARLNVVHEAGLFQGRIGFPRAIILLEDGCEEFSNIHGLGQIRFPKDQVSAVFEDIRKVLEREHVI
jgi:predicted nucleotide-binding protein